MSHDQGHDKLHPINDTFSKALLSGVKASERDAGEQVQSMFTMFAIGAGGSRVT